jgi:TPR repeat protein
MKGSELGTIAAAVLAVAASFAAVAAESREAATPTVAAEKKKAPAPDRKAAERHYRRAKGLEKKGDERGAFAAYLAAGNAGHGLAQKRLGEIYEKGNSATRRDYDTALRWYEKARAQGIAIPKPITLQRGH